MYKYIHLIAIMIFGNIIVIYDFICVEHLININKKNQNTYLHFLIKIILNNCLGEYIQSMLRPGYNSIDKSRS